jgi:hypothetical protein
MSGFGTGMGQEMHTGVEPVTVGNIFVFMIWGIIMLVYIGMMAVVSLVVQFSNFPTFAMLRMNSLLGEHCVPQL